MRKDMKKVLAETGRTPSFSSEFESRRNRHRDKIKLLHDDDFDLETRRGMKNHVLRGNKKSRRINIQPLKRFLTSRIGERWDDVYSEISETLRSSYENHRNLKISRLVLVKPIFENGVAYRASWNHELAELGKYSDEFYVDQDGKLQLAKTKVKSLGSYRKSDFSDKRVLTDDIHIQYHKIDGIWYELTLRDAQEHEKKDRRFYPNFNDTKGFKILSDLIRDNYDSIYSEFETARILFGGYMYPVSRKQLSKKEIKHLIQKKENNEF